MNIRNVTDIGGLLEYFRDRLNWDIGIESFDDVEDFMYGFDAGDLGLKDEEFAKVKSLYQLPPLEEKQQWGIFCVEFNTEKFSVTALRKILSRLVPTRRNATAHTVWNEKDLLFICFWGTGGNRTICIAHFEQQTDALSQVRTIHCSPAIEDPAVLSHFENKLAQLKWPSETSDYGKWHDSWSAAFDTCWGEVIRTSDVLAARMAKVAKGIKDRILEAMDVETADGFTHRLFSKVKDRLVHDIDESKFADMYAQMIVYGFFSARCLDQTPETFSMEEAIELIPNTNPFLKEMMLDCCTMPQGGGVSFDELGVGDVVEMLAHVDAARIAADFGRRTGGGREDPVIYFYEEFLEAYDKEQKVKCGEFYTPMPVVGFMVRAVDYILRTHFNMPDGFATEASKTIRVEKTGKKGGKEIKKEQVPAIQVLDPALGTGTFLREIILNIHGTFRSSHPELKDESLSETWSRYVDRNVLPRLNGFELMMAPYAIAHMKLAMVLKDTGYDFKGDKRLQVYLTNSLEEPGDDDPQGKLFDDDPLAAESIAANGVKKNYGINIVIGNPPYNKSSTNKGEWILSMIKEYKEGLNEQKINLDDDYIKFIRLGQEYVRRSGRGILAFITNNSFIGGVTHRQMRKALLETFDEIYILNLHGNARKKETCPDGSPDKNVFDIKQGVSINVFVKTGVKQSAALARVHYAELFGSRESKYSALATDFAAVPWRDLAPVDRYWFFIPKDLSLLKVYDQGISVVDLFPLYNSGIQTKNDDLVVSFSEKRVEMLIKDFETLTELQIREKYNLPKEDRVWNLSTAMSDLATNTPNIVSYSYRPFDSRFTAYTGMSQAFMGRSRDSVMRHFRQRNNVGFVFCRTYSATDFHHFFVTNAISDIHLISDQSYICPLYVYKEYYGNMQKELNLNPEIVKKIEASLGEKPAPEELFNYLYAVLHSPSYRERYQELLEIDFPRIPYPTDAAAFHALAALGAQLVAIHVMKDFDEAGDVSFEDGGDRVVGKVEWKDGDVFVNKKSCFTGVERETFDQYIGGYQPLQKWLKDRKGRALSDDDISHWKRIVRALRRTAELMAEIDRVWNRPSLATTTPNYPLPDDSDTDHPLAAESHAAYDAEQGV